MFSGMCLWECRSGLDRVHLPERIDGCGAFPTPVGSISMQLLSRRCHSFCSIELQGARIDYSHNCGEAGCLFNVLADRGEHTDLSAQQPARVAAMAGVLADERAMFFSNTDTGTDSCPSTITGSCGCWMAKHKYGGAFGPFQEVAGVPPDP